MSIPSWKKLQTVREPRRDRVETKMLSATHYAEAVAVSKFEWTLPPRVARLLPIPSSSLHATRAMQWSKKWLVRAFLSDQRLRYLPHGTGSSLAHTIDPKSTAFASIQRW